MLPELGGTSLYGLVGMVGMVWLCCVVFGTGWSGWFCCAPACLVRAGRERLGWWEWFGCAASCLGQAGRDGRDGLVASCVGQPGRDGRDGADNYSCARGIRQQLDSDSTIRFQQLDSDSTIPILTTPVKRWQTTFNGDCEGKSG